uniref:Transport and Golgi organisation 2 n=1 Tax=Candidatus Kentrum sp. DK TaxID=2126562 RepID=A0A450S5W7_9GAMM|nr:MAG: Transport and Golgi organisation 2 [Candidatus Kentron sp. DK]
MCLILLSCNAHPRYRLILAANRDEFHHRPTAPLAFWEDRPDILAGRDIRGGGTWLGITRTGRFSALTNFREPDSLGERALSRGLLVRGFLESRQSPVDYLADLEIEGNRYDGFNLLVGDSRGLYCYSNRENRIQELSPGVHGPRSLSDLG